MTDREIMQQALEALEAIMFTKNVGSAHIIAKNARYSLREALAKGGQKPTLFFDRAVYFADPKTGEKLAQPEQEPVAWANPTDLDNFDMKVRTCGSPLHTVPLYTAPPKRAWVGLTDEDEQQCRIEAGAKYVRHKNSIRGQMISPADEYEWHLIRAIEAKLKEKNT